MAIEFPTPEVAPVQAAPPGRAIGVISLALLVVSITFSVAGQLTLKSAMTRVGRIGRAEVAAATKTLTRVLKEPRVWVGLALFGISAGFYLIVLSRVPLSIAYPVVGFSYVLIVGLSRFVLAEHVPPLRWIGVAVIAVGVALIGLSYERLTGS